MADEQKSGPKLAPADFRTDSFDPSVEGVEPLTQEGTQVSKAKEKEARDAAERMGVELREVK